MSAELLALIGTCPGLRIGDAGLVWTDAIGRNHILAKSPRLSIGEAATRLGVDDRTVRRLIDANVLYPALRRSGRYTEVYEVAVTDVLHRETIETLRHQAKVKEAAHA